LFQLESFALIKPPSVNKEDGKFSKLWSQSGFSKILTDDLWINFNWAGVKGKMALKSYELFQNVIFGKINFEFFLTIKNFEIFIVIEAWSDEKWTTNTYSEYATKATASAHNRYHKKKSRINLSLESTF
jgi:Domain of unknown function (DUF4806)